MNKLPEEFKTKWIAALRSGEYIQGTNRMIDNNGNHCCLAVACRVVGVVPKGAVISENEGYSPEELSKIPLILHGPAHQNKAVVGELTERNDFGESFSEIADWIEQNL